MVVDLQISALSINSLLGFAYCAFKNQGLWCCAGLCCTKRSVAQSVLALQAEAGGARPGVPWHWSLWLTRWALLQLRPELRALLCSKTSLYKIPAWPLCYHHFWYHLSSACKRQPQEPACGAWPEAGEPQLQHCPGPGHPVKPSRGHWELLYFPPVFNSHSGLVRMMNYVLQTGFSRRLICISQRLLGSRAQGRCWAGSALPGAALASLGCRPWPGLGGSQSPGLLQDGTTVLMERWSSFLSGVFNIQLYIFCFIPGCVSVSLQSVTCLENVNILGIRL